MAEFFDRMEAFRTSVNSSRSAIEQMERWKITPPQMALSPTSSGQDVIRLDSSVQETFRKVIEDIAPAVSGAMNRHLVPVAERAFKNWPVDSGVSKALLFLSFTPSADGSAIVAALGDRAPYAHLIYKGRTKSAKKAAKKGFDELHPKAQENILRAKQRRADRDERNRKTDERRAKIGLRKIKRRRGRKSPRAGEVTNRLIFEPGVKAADAIATDIATAVSRGGS